MEKLNKFPYFKFNAGLRTFWVNNKLTYLRGMGYFDLLKQPLLALTALKIFDVSYTILYCLVPIWVVFWWSIGWLDRFRWKFWQEEALFSPKHIDPWQQEIMARLTDIQERLIKIEAKNE